ncbi:MAG: biotin/lipoyl-containing protein, partial [Holosporales bacterium]
MSSIAIKVPALGESVTEATIARWLKKPGEAVKVDEPVVELETDKVTQEVYAPASGVLGADLIAQGKAVPIGAIIGSITEGAAPAATNISAPVAVVATPVVSSPVLMPAAQKLAAEKGLSPSNLTGTGK